MGLHDQRGVSTEELILGHRETKKGRDEEEEFCAGEGDGFDAVVVGSGYGGSVAAYRMSVAGIKVCLIEKGRRWNTSDFPATSVQMMSAVRMEASNWGISFGSKNALFQVNSAVFMLPVYAYIVALTNI